MGPKATPAKQKNTLFSYFAKGSTPKEGDQSKAAVLAPKKSPNESKVSPATPLKKGILSYISSTLKLNRIFLLSIYLFLLIT